MKCNEILEENEPLICDSMISDYLTRDRIFRCRNNTVSHDCNCLIDDKACRCQARSLCSSGRAPVDSEMLDNCVTTIHTKQLRYSRKVVGQKKLVTR